MEPNTATALNVIPLGQLLAKGGLTMIPIYLCSLAAAAVFVQKMLQFRASKLSDLGWFERALAHVKGGRLDQANAACDETANPAGRVVRATTSALSSRPDRAEAEAQRVGSLELQRLEKHLSVLSFLAQVAPLLGLLGTVLGMVDLFLGLQQSGQGEVSVSLLSSGIWKALLTTAAGLAVAVPALAGYSYLTSRADAFRLQLSDLVQRLLTAAPLGPAQS